MNAPIDEILELGRWVDGMSSDGVEGLDDVERGENRRDHEPTGRLADIRRTPSVKRKGLFNAEAQRRRTQPDSQIHAHLRSKPKV